MAAAKNKKWLGALAAAAALLWKLKFAVVFVLTKGKLPVDILKVPHHGSHRNSAVEFFEMIPARNYVISAEGDGKHPNPAQKTFEELFKARPKGPYTIWMTNTPPKGVKALKKLPPGVTLNTTPKTKPKSNV